MLFVARLLRLLFVTRSLDCTDCIHYADGVVVGRGRTSESEWVKELFNCNLAFVKRLKEISMDTTEFSILNAIVLTYPGEFLAGNGSENGGSKTCHVV